LDNKRVKMEKAIEILKWLTSLPVAKLARVIFIVVLGGFAYYIHLDIDNMKKELEKCSKARMDFEAFKIESLFAQASKSEVPVAKWLKNKNGLMLEINSAYEQKYLRPRNISRSFYLANQDVNIWGNVVSDEFKRHDSTVLYEDKPMVFIELAGSKEIRVLKWPWKINGVVFGVGGMEYEEFNN
jgi:hypothetical protein